MAMITGYVPPNARATFRRSYLVAGPLALGVLVVGVPLGAWAAALFVVLGLALGVGNSWLVLRSAARFADAAGAAGPAPAGKGRLAVTAVTRLALVTAIALGCALLVPPAGLGVLAGLATFQLIVVISASMPLIKELRQS